MKPDETFMVVVQHGQPHTLEESASLWQSPRRPNDITRMVVPCHGQPYKREQETDYTKIRQQFDSELTDVNGNKI